MSDDKDRYYRRDDRHTQWWFIGSGLVLELAIVFAVFITHDNRTEQPARITPIPSASQTMTVTETPVTLTETPPVTLTETSTATVIVTRTEPVTSTVTTTVTAVPVP